MSNLNVNPLEAQNQATKLSQAADQLDITVPITFSSETTISGNAEAKKSVETLKRYTETVQAAVLRDVSSVQSIVSTFVRKDQKMGQNIQKSMIDLPGPDKNFGGS
ncbi:TIGR04197 family type VII secretion effector [Enterococcus sp. LJL51]|uniref:TIGR04197 family type VII secretion effector n=1 Tax=Enterococcus sp. LJL51 TaxID=3416656 RepID=UPI003CF3D13E